MNPDPSSIDEYIRANRGRYTDEAIRKTLASAGHDPAAIEEAYRRVTAPRLATGLVTEAWVLLGVGGALGLLGFGLASSFGTSTGLPLFLLGYAGIGTGLALLLRWAVPRFGIRGGWGGLIGFLLVPAYGALMFGTCLAAFKIGQV